MVAASSLFQLLHHDREEPPPPHPFGGRPCSQTSKRSAPDISSLVTPKTIKKYGPSGIRASANRRRPSPVCGLPQRARLGLPIEHSETFGRPGTPANRQLRLGGRARFYLRTVESVLAQRIPESLIQCRRNTPFVLFRTHHG